MYFSASYIVAGEMIENCVGNNGSNDMKLFQILKYMESLLYPLLHYFADILPDKVRNQIIEYKVNWLSKTSQLWLAWSESATMKCRTDRYRENVIQLLRVVSLFLTIGMSSATNLANIQVCFIHIDIV